MICWLLQRKEHALGIESHPARALHQACCRSCVLTPGSAMGQFAAEFFAVTGALKPGDRDSDGQT